VILLSGGHCQVINMIFTPFLAAFTLGGIFLFYTGMCCAALLFVGLIVPETKNKSLEEISKDLKNK
jgi:hypothetical protein